MKAVKIIFLMFSLLVCITFAQQTDEKDKQMIPENVSSQDKTDLTKIQTTTSDIINTENTQKSIPIINRTNERYRIGFQDVLQVTVDRHPDLTQTVSVDQDGTILLSRINQPIVAVCKTERELSSLITELYKNYLRKPFVSVRTLEQRSQPFAVMGAVNKPGNFFLNQKITLLQLLSYAGGQDVEKSGSRIQVARIGSLSGCNPTDENDEDIEFLSYQLNDVLSGKDNPWMQPGDIVSVLEAEEAYVIGEVFEPAKIVLKEPITLSEAIAKAGGLSSTAKSSQIVIQRKEKDSPVRTQLVFNLKDIKERKIPDPLIQANDIVEVSTSNAKVLKKGLLKILTNGVGNIFYRIPL